MFARSLFAGRHTSVFQFAIALLGALPEIS
jgi:hypothetical protein